MNVLPRVKVRAPQRRWVRFIQLELGEAFTWQNKEVCKCGAFQGRRWVAGQTDPARFTVWPWQKVRSFRPVKNLKKELVAPKAAQHSGASRSYALPPDFVPVSARPARCELPGNSSEQVQNQSGPSA